MIMVQSTSAVCFCPGESLVARYKNNVAPSGALMTGSLFYQNTALTGLYLKTIGKSISFNDNGSKYFCGDAFTQAPIHVLQRADSQSSFLSHLRRKRNLVKVWETSLPGIRNRCRPVGGRSIRGDGDRCVIAALIWSPNSQVGTTGSMVADQ
ncbi:MAG: hypothetical protein KF679_09185 [Chitinophagaceae bacterium]|nr:hypothetical protein [Chitinophagaceae bacterium]